MQLTFVYDEALLQQYPDVIGGIILARGMQNVPTSPTLQALYTQEQQTVLQRLGDTPLSELPSLSAWRAAFRKFGVDPTQYRSAAEALLRRLTKKGDIPSINTLVDLGNLVSIRYRLPVAVMDAAQLTGPIRVHLADGSERFTELDAVTVEHPAVGEVVFTDSSKMVLARRWCWRQANEVAARETTTDAIITIEGHHTHARAEVQAALDDLLKLLPDYAGGRFQHGLLSAAQPRLSENA
jgi:DNA/RNA-binding domain of Phe-tRNA-synthetase-like protein